MALSNENVMVIVAVGGFVFTAVGSVLAGAVHGHTTGRDAASSEIAFLERQLSEKAERASVCQAELVDTKSALQARAAITGTAVATLPAVVASGSGQASGTGMLMAAGTPIVVKDEAESRSIRENETAAFMGGRIVVGLAEVQLSSMDGRKVTVTVGTPGRESAKKVLGLNETISYEGHEVRTLAITPVDATITVRKLTEASKPDASAADAR